MKKSLSILTFTLFLLSGATGLAYETLWIRILALGVGSTSQSMSLVLSIFFFGLSLGSFLSGRFAERVNNSLLVYGVIEVSLGVVASVLLFPLFNLHKLLVLLPLTGAFSWFGILAKFISVALLLIVPTALMGATLPLLVRALSQIYGSIGKSVSRLYAINTLGAVLGAFLTGYFFIPKLGVVYANSLAAFLNVLIGGTAIWLSQREPSFSAPALAHAEKALVSVKLSGQQKLILFSTGVSGFVSIAAEVVWNKYLNIYFGTNIYGIGLVLALFLFGIAAGSFLLSLFIDKISNKKSLYISLFCLSAVALVISSRLLSFAPQFSLYLQTYTGGIFSLLWVKSFVITALLLLPTLIFGALFPLAISILADSQSSGVRTVGLAYSVNTVGAILGSYFAGLVLIPHFGSAMTLKAIVILSFVLAVFLVYATLEDRKIRLRYVSAIAAMALLCVQAGNMDFKNLIKSAYQQAGYTASLHTEKQDWLKSQLKYFDPQYEDFKLIVEGETAVISLSHDPQDGEENQNYLRLKTSGLNESVYNLRSPEELPKYEALIGLLPYLFSRAPKSAFVVGYGGGFTVDFLTSTDIRKVNVAELEKGILDAADYVFKGNNPITERPNLNLKIEDARFVLASHLWGKQDIIISQPSHSWLSGAANLFTEEFFTIVKGNLTERGVFSQWLNLYNMDVPVLKSILKTFYTVFPYGAVFTQAGDHELVLLGSNHPLELNLRKLEMIKENPVFKNKLTQVFTHSSFDLLSMYSLSREEALLLTDESKKNTDVNAFAEVRQSRIFYEGLKGAQTPQNYLSSVFSGDLSHIVRSADTPEFYVGLLDSLNDKNQYDKFPLVLARYEEKVKGDPASASRLGYLCFRANRFQSAFRYLTEAFKKTKNVEIFNTLLSTLVEMERFPEVLLLVKKHSALTNKLAECYWSQALMESGNVSKMDSVLSKIVKDVPGYTEACGGYANKIIGQYYVTKREPNIAIPFLEAYYRDFPTDVRNLQRMVQSYRSIHDLGNEKQFQDYLPTAIEAERQKLQVLIDFLRGKGMDEDASVLASKAAKLSRPLLSE